MENKIKKILLESAKLSATLANDPKVSRVIGKITQDIVKSLRNGGKVIVFGNGGSAADSQHFACELIGRFKRQRRSIPAIALTSNAATLTAIANDYNFNAIFSRQVCGLGKRGDVAIGISTSGNSQNVLEAIKKANKLKLVTVGITGKSGGKLKPLCKHALCVPSSDVPRIQELHAIAIHVIAELVEEFCQ